MSSSSQLDRFSCGFYEDYIVDKVLLTFLNNHVRKNQRGQEMKAMAWEYLKNAQPELVQDILNTLGVNLTPQQISINTINVAVDSRSTTPLVNPINLTNVSRLNQNVVYNTPTVDSQVMQEEVVTINTDDEPVSSVSSEYTLKNVDEQPVTTNHSEVQEPIQQVVEEEQLPEFVKIGGISTNHQPIKKVSIANTVNGGVNLNTNSYD